MQKTIALILVVALSPAVLSGCAALDAAHMAWQGAVIAGDLLGGLKVKSPSPKQQAPVSPSTPAGSEAEAAVDQR